MRVLTVYPYLLHQTWVFDDARTGLKEEAFVLGMTEMISRLVEAKAIPHAQQGFTLRFSDDSFDGADVQLTWLHSDDSQVVPGQDGSASQLFGNWYGGTVAGEAMEGWLCPALGLYFKTAPAHLFVQAEPLPAGVDPVWHVRGDDARAVRFVSASPTAG